MEYDQTDITEVMGEASSPDDTLIRGDFAKTDCSQKRIFRLKAKKIKKYAKPNHGIFLFSP